MTMKKRTSPSASPSFIRRPPTSLAAPGFGPLLKSRHIALKEAALGESQFQSLTKKEVVDTLSSLLISFRACFHSDVYIFWSTYNWFWFRVVPVGCRATWSLGGGERELELLEAAAAGDLALDHDQVAGRAQGSKYQNASSINE